MYIRQLQVAQDVRDGSNRERLEKFSPSEDKSNGVGAVEAAMLSFSVEDETEKAILSLSEAAEKIDPSHFATCLDEVLVSEIRIDPFCLNLEI